MKILKLWLPVVIWAGLIFCVSSIPYLKTNLKYDFILRKGAHVVEYGVLTFLLYRAFQGTFNMTAFGLFAYPVLLSFLYAASDEFHQTFVPGRSGNVTDVLIDGIGIFGFYVVIQIITANRKGGEARNQSRQHLSKTGG